MEQRGFELSTLEINPQATNACGSIDTTMIDRCGQHIADKPGHVTLGYLGKLRYLHVGYLRRGQRSQLNIIDATSRSVTNSEKSSAL